MTTLRDRFDREYSESAIAFAESVFGIDTSGIPEPHLPLWGKSYEDSEARIGIIGRDTLGWGEMKDFVHAVGADPVEAVHRGEDEFRSFAFREWTNNFGTNFWDTTFKILAGLHGISDWKQLRTASEGSPLERFFWANVNSVERFDVTPEENGVEWETWRKVKDASEKHFDSLRRVLSVFRPNVVFVMNWDPGDAFLDLDLSWDEFGDHQAYAYERDFETHILVTAHPSWLNRNGLYVEAVEGITRRANNALQSDA